MKKAPLLLLLVAVTFLIGCPGVPVKVDLPNPMAPSVECNQQLDQITAGKAGESLIRAKIPNPCDAYRAMATLAKVGIVWDFYKAGALAEWTDRVGEKIVVGMTYADLNTLLSSEITRFNLKLGGTYLLVSDLLVTFNEQTLISGKDQAILMAGLIKMRDDAKRLAMLAFWDVSAWL